jgi:hypothetical protein
MNYAYWIFGLVVVVCAILILCAIALYVVYLRECEQERDELDAEYGEIGLD